MLLLKYLLATKIVMHQHDTPTDGVLFGWNTDTNSLALHKYHHLIGGLEVPKGSHLMRRSAAMWRHLWDVVGGT